MATWKMRSPQFNFNFGCVAFCLSLLLAFRADASEKFTEALQAFKQENYDKSQALFIELVKSSPKNMLYWFNLGNSYYELKQYPQAIKAYARVGRSGSPLKPVAYLYAAKAYDRMGQREMALSLTKKVGQFELPPNLKKDYLSFKLSLQAGRAQRAKALYRQGQYEESHRALQDYLKRHPDDESAQLFKGVLELKMGKREQAQSSWRRLQQSRLPGVRRQADDLLKSLESASVAGFQATLEALYGNNSNVYGDSESESPLASPEMKLFASLGYKATLNERWQLTPSYYFDQSEASEAVISQTRTHSLNVSARYREADHHLFVAPFYRQSTLEGNAYMSEAGSSVGYSRALGRHELGGRATSISKAGQGSYSYLSGSDIYSKAHYGYNFKRAYVEVYISLSKVGGGSLELTEGVVPLAYRSTGGGLKAYGLLGDSWIVILHASRMSRLYAGESQRRDVRATYELGVQKKLSHSWRWVVASEYRSNRSNFDANSPDDKNYNQTQIYTGVRWDLQ